jgi:hypothetical protein
MGHLLLCLRLEAGKCVQKAGLAKSTLPSWKVCRYSLVTWWDMAKFDGSTFCLLCSHLHGLEKNWKANRESPVPAEVLKSIIDDLGYLEDKCTEAGLNNSAGYISDNIVLLADGINYGYVDELFGNFGFQMRSEMKRTEFLLVDKPRFYGESPLFDHPVTDVYPQLTFDVVEAGNCLALNRSTACVFHLMRIVEVGVQLFGKKLGVPLTNEKVWQVILDQVNKHIGAMPEKPPARKRQKERYADVAGHLYNVKVAWRNPLMHPKRTYTPEEAEHLFISVKAFMLHLVTLIKPTAVRESIALAAAAPAMSYMRTMEGLNLGDTDEK